MTLCLFWVKYLRDLPALTALTSTLEGNHPLRKLRTDYDHTNETPGSLVTVRTVTPNVNGSILNIAALAELPKECSHLSDSSYPTGWCLAMPQQIAEIDRETATKKTDRETPTHR